MKQDGQAKLADRQAMMDRAAAQIAQVAKVGGFFCRSTTVLIVLVCAFLLLFSVPSYRTFDLLTPQNDDSRRLQHLIELWEESYFSNKSADFRSVFPAAPHIEDCERRSEEAKKLDNRDPEGKRPVWRGEFGTTDDEFERGGLLFNNSNIQQEFYPPWIEGSDADNLPLTRRVQRDLWLHQHPKNCSDPNLKFLVTDWENSRALGLGAQIVAMSGMFAIALNESRIFVLKDFNRARHEGCAGSSYGRWSCYFVSETSDECRARAAELESQESAWSQGIITTMGNYTKVGKWFNVPGFWGEPWQDMQAFDVVDGQILGKHKAMDRQWWRAQAVRYLVRFRSQYLCKLLNQVRHHAFGKRAAKITLQTLPKNWPEVGVELNRSEDLHNRLWGDQKPWMPRPLLSMHVRQGDKALEMKIFDFKAHMILAEEVRSRFPQLKDVWLSTEMQNVVEEAAKYTNWNFHFTKIQRQNGTTRMGDYERSLGRRESSNNAFVNLFMAVECDYFVGALGSTWSFLIDGLRTTAGKLKLGFLSVNKDRYW